MLVGDRSRLSAGLNASFRRSGLSHLLVVSGLHLVILSRMVSLFLAPFVQERRRAFFLIGFCWSLAENYNFSANTRAFLFTGLFGGFTTFSSFALDTMSLIKIGDYKLALLNILASNVLGLIAVFLGLLLGKNVLSLMK